MHHKGFTDRLRGATIRSDSLVCVGLDPDIAKFPAHLRDLGPREAIVQFNSAIVEATRDLVCAYKPNLGFYVAYGAEGLEALVETRRMIPVEIPVILDCKVGDMDNTAARYAKGYFEEWGFDAVTANPFLGEDSLAPFLGYADRGVIVLCKTSNPGSGDLQDLVVRDGEWDRALFLALAERAQRWSETYPASVGLVVGATYPAQLAEVRAICPELPILLPGVGAQAGDLAAAVTAGVDARGEGLMVSSSRGVIYAGSGEDFAERAREAAKRLRDEVNAVRRQRVLAAG
ncbi:MAG: orotidine-5-phosphate decarboxylase [Thermomicrobiales bacterium]|nr:orotidine-5-phosphate decarboxylase [Thermomicrobiales bacterium]